MGHVLGERWFAKEVFDMATGAHPFLRREFRIDT